MALYSCVSTSLPNHSLLFSQAKHSTLPINKVATLASFPSKRRRVAGRLYSVISVRAESRTTVIEKFGIKIERNPPEARLTELGVRQWETWSGPPSPNPFTYESSETAYILEGKAKVTPVGENESIEIASGDLVLLRKGLSLNWELLDPMKLHYIFQEKI